MPGAYARTASQALTNATFPYLESLADYGLEGACRHRPALASGVVIGKGHVTNQAVAESLCLSWEPFQL